MTDHNFKDINLSEQDIDIFSLEITNESNCRIHINFDFSKNCENFAVHMNKCSETASKAVFKVFDDFNLKDSMVSITFVTEDRIRELNSEYRNIDEYTDVLSFSLDGGGDEYCRGLLGDIVISYERARGSLLNDESSPDYETSMLCVHGMLHLLGMDHDMGPEEGEPIFIKQALILKSLGFQHKKTVLF